MSFEVKDSVALVTGANRGIGRSYVEALVAAGAKKVYATARNPAGVQDLVDKHADIVVSLALDVANPAQVRAAAAEASDVTLLVNNAGVATGSFVLASEDLSGMRRDLEVNLFGTADMVRTFAPVLSANGSGAIVIINSVASFINFPMFGGYSASKAALHSFTQCARAELAPKGVSVVGVYPGPIDTDMAKPLEMDKESPTVVADATLAALNSGTEDVFPDSMAVDFANNYKADWKAVERNVGASMVPA